LLSGVAASAVLACLGLLLVFVQQEPRPETPPPGLGTLLLAAMHGRGVAILDLALLLLMATPLLRVAVLALGWARSGDRRFTGVALIVLGLLALSLLLGVA
jgi:uncharacterized membrane protein